MVQPDLHPDADVLNAFAERALPEAERGRVVAHMAGCVRCRDVVFLAQAAAQPELSHEIAPARAANAEPRPGWFSAAFAKWRMALIPAAALGAVGGIVLWVQLRPGTQGTEMAKMVPPDAPLQQAATAQSTARQAEPAAPSQQAARGPAPPPAGQGPALDGIHMDGRSAALSRYSPPAPPPGPAPVTAFSAEPRSSETQLQLRTPLNANAQSVSVESAGPMVPAPAPAPPNIVAMDGASNAELAPQPMNGMAVMRLARRTKLPSGLNTVSSAALLNRLVAVDSAGGVFQSQDGGNHWDAVFPHWTGKAIQVQAPPHPLYALMPATNAQTRELTSISAQAPQAAAPEENPAASASPPSAGANAAPSPASSRPKPKAKASPPFLPMQFKLVTDRHEILVSADGKVWREQ
jgi:Putative zinc-finger